MSWLGRIVNTQENNQNQARPTQAAQQLLVPDVDHPEEEAADQQPIMPTVNYDAAHADDEEGNAMNKTKAKVVPKLYCPRRLCRLE